MAFSTRLRDLREQAELSQADLAERAGLSKGGVADLEQGRRKPALETAQKLARALGVTCQAFDEELGESTMEEEPKRGRGRPTKPKEEAPGPKRPRGRPRKEKE